MTIDEFKATLTYPDPPPGVTGALLALWHDGRGNWDAAHEIAQDVEDESGAWVHAYLHRKEGDPGNAAYWYRRARKPEARMPLGDEWALIVASLLA